MFNRPYSDSHKGFAIEYDLDKLHTNSFEIEYTNTPMDIDILDFDFNSAATMQRIKKILGYKSIAWSYEEEIRIIYENAGLKTYSCDAITGIYFGLRMKDKYKKYLQSIFKKSHIKFYQIKHKENSYELEAEELPNNIN